MYRKYCYCLRYNSYYVLILKCQSYIFFMKRILKISLIVITCFVILFLGVGYFFAEWGFPYIFKKGLSSPQLILNTDTTRKISYDFELLSYKTKTALNNASLKNKVLFINLWEPWCMPCIAEIPSIDSLYQKVKDSTEIMFLEISTINPDKTSKKIARLNSNLPFYHSLKSLGPPLADSIIPKTVVVNKEGVVVLELTGGYKWNAGEVVRLLDSLKAE